MAFAIFDAVATEIHGASSVQALGFDRQELILFAEGTTAVFAIHFLAYYLFATHREFSYLRAGAIGIDIDGVLNRHREKFCELAISKLGKQVNSDDIKVLPVHENVGLAAHISRDDERAIFNDPKYWVDMRPLDGAADAIKTIRNSFLLPVHIFTHRPWPDISDSTTRQSWRDPVDLMVRHANAKDCVRQWINLVTAIDVRMAMYYITKYWLREHGIVYDSLLVEKGNENIVYARGRYENRFNYARKKKIKFFVEDDWVKAIKLSYICDVVFLIDHPYNRPTRQDAQKHENEAIIGRMPTNVIRVQTWNELNKLIAQLV